MDGKRIWRIAAVAAGALVTAALVYALKNALIPVGVAIILAYLLDPVIDRLEARKINRSVGIFILAGVISITVVALGGFLIIKGQQEVARLYTRIELYLNPSENEPDSVIKKYLDKATPIIKQYTGYDLGPSLDSIFRKDEVPPPDGTFGPDQAPQTLVPGPDPDASADTSSPDQFLKLDPGSLKPVSALLQKITSSTLSFIGYILGLLIIPVFLFYFLRDWDKMKVEVVEYIPYSYRDYVVDKAGKIDQIMGAFIRGQLTVCIVLGVLYSMGLMIVGIDFAVLIGMAAGLLFIVPYLGTIIGVVAASAMALLTYGLSWHLVGVWAVFGIVQLFEGMVLTPRVMGDKVGLSPVVVIFALLVGSDLLGLLGMLIAVPAAAVIKVFITEAIQKYRASDFFLEKTTSRDPADPPGPGSHTQT